MEERRAFGDVAAAAKGVEEGVEVVGQEEKDGCSWWGCGDIFFFFFFFGGVVAGFCIFLLRFAFCVLLFCSLPGVSNEKGGGRDPGKRVRVPPRFACLSLLGWVQTTTTMMMLKLVLADRTSSALHGQLSVA